ncbi:MAG: tol-pal system protein YbgF [Bacteroidota bacterium]
MHRAIIFNCIVFFVLTNSYALYGQEEEGEYYLLTDMNVQIDVTSAINNMYNFKFEEADKQYRWLKQEYPWHPLPYFLLGLSQWWRMIPNLSNTKYDQKLEAYMDTAIVLSKNLYKKKERNIEAAFFLAGAYAFQARLYSERKKWRKTASVGKSALKYMNEARGHEDFSPEILFGEALYNYYSVWVSENYPLLKPILVFFKKGDKELGIEQLKTVASNAFYTRTEAQYFLMRILSSENIDRAYAFQVSKYLYNTFPDNAYFHRYYARLLYSKRQFHTLEKVASQIVERIDSGKVGYEEISGRYASFFLGQIYESFGKQEKAIKYYYRSVEFSEKINALETGYYHYSMLALAEIAKEKGERKEAKKWVKKIKKNAKRKSQVHKRARELL